MLFIKKKVEKINEGTSFVGLPPNTKLKKAEMMAHKGDCDINRLNCLELPQGAHKN